MTALSAGFNRQARPSEAVLTMPEQAILLIVDDERSITAAVADLFRNRYRVITASGAEEALAHLEHSDVAVIISDQRMPKVTGAELLAQVAISRPDITRIMLTGYADLESVITAVNKGQIYFYLTKPWQESEVIAVVDKAVEYHSLLCERNQLISDLREANASLEAKVEARTSELKRTSPWKRQTSLRMSFSASPHTTCARHSAGSGVWRNYCSMKATSNPKRRRNS